MSRDRTLGFLLGVGLGAVAGVLFAPSSGANLRKSIADTADETAGAAKKQVNDMWNSTSDVLANGVARVGRARDALKTAAEAGKQAYHDSAVNNA